MILDKMKFLFRLNLGNFSSDVHVSEHMLYFAELFFDVSEDGRWFEAATDRGIPVSALFPEDFFVAVDDKFTIVVSFWDDEDEFFEEDVVLVCFF